MFQDLVTATQKILQNNFAPYDPQRFGRSSQFELYINDLLLDVLGFSKGSIENFNSRKFDIKKHNKSGNYWEVCEIGHEISNRGYLAKLNGKLNNMGLINKLFFDYIKNYQYKLLVPKSYAYLYFSLENNVNLMELNKLISAIINIYPNSHAIKQIDVLNNQQVVKGKILIIDGLNSINDVRNLYQTNPNIQQYVKPIERGWDKHEILMGLKNPWD